MSDSKACRCPMCRPKVGLMSIPRKAAEAIHSVICEESLEDHMDPMWPGRCVKAAQAAAPHLMAEAWDRGEAAGRSYAMRLMSDEPRAPKPTNPYREQVKP